MTPDAPPFARTLVTSAAAYAWFARGYECGYEHGLADGHAAAGQEWTDVTSAACRAGMRLDVWADAQEARRRPPAREARTAERIRDEAHRSWEVEAPT